MTYVAVLFEIGYGVKAIDLESIGTIKQARAFAKLWKRADPHSLIAVTCCPIAVGNPATLVLP